jgi:hypothetical protein
MVKSTRNWQPHYMDEPDNKRMFAFPAVQQQEQIQLILQSLAPLRRNLKPRVRQRFDGLVRRSRQHTPLYRDLNHLSPVEFMLLSFIIELLNDRGDEFTTDHPPFP